MRVVIALDDTPYSRHLLDLVCRRHWAPDTEFKLVHVVEPLCVSEWTPEDMANLQDELNHRREKIAEKLLSDARHRIEKKFPEARVHFELRHGRPATEIVRAATDWAADSILLGAHSREICPHNLLGSVSRGVAERSPCSVEIIRRHSIVKAEQASDLESEAAKKQIAKSSV